MRYLWILLIPMMAFAGLRGDKDRDPRHTFTGDRVSDDGDRRTQASDGIPSGGVARSAALSKMVPWRQIEQWIIFEGKSNRQVFRLLNKQGPPPGGSGKPLGEGFSNKGNPFRRPSPVLFGDEFHYGWSRFFSPSYHGLSSIVNRFGSIPKPRTFHRKRIINERGEIISTGYWSSCRAFTARIRKYWRRYHSGETAPQPCTPEPLPEKQARKFSPNIVPHKPPPTTITDIQAAPRQDGPTIDQGSRTSYNASDGRPIQGQNYPGHHRATGSATLSSGQVIIDLNTNVGAGRNDLSFIDLNFVGHARSTDTSNSNTYTVYALSKSKILIRSSSGTDTATVNFTVEGQ